MIDDLSLMGFRNKKSRKAAAATHAGFAYLLDIRTAIIKCVAGILKFFFFSVKRNSAAGLAGDFCFSDFTNHI